MSCEWVEVPHDDDHEDTDESSLNVKSLKDLGLTYTWTGKIYMLTTTKDVDQQKTWKFETEAKKFGLF